VLDEQQQSLVDFLLSSLVGTCPCPLSASDKNLQRFDPEDATKNKVYRDIWEQEPPNGRRFGGCVLSALDYPKEALWVNEAQEEWRNASQSTLSRGPV
jgi:hypothetical protein